MSIAELPSSSSEFERTPPHDMPAEQCVLGGMLLSKDAVSDVVEVLRPDDFYRPAHQVIFEAVIDLYARGEPADAVTIAAELTKRGALPRAGGAPYLHTLISSVPTAANAGYYAKIVRERAILRRLIEAGTRIVQLGYGSDGEIDDAVDRAQAEVYNVTENRTSEDYHPLSEVMPGALDELEAIGSRGGQMVGVPTGFADLDSLMNGLHPGQLVVVAARPAMGKCLVGASTIIEARTGDRVRLDEFVRRGQAGEDLRVHTLGNDWVLWTTRPTAFLDNGVRPVWRVGTRLGRAVTATRNHPFLTRRGWVDLGDLKPGDEIAVPRGPEASSAPIPDAACREPDVYASVRIWDDHIAWDEIDSITEAGEERVYDLTVPGSHNFVAEDIIVHNSTLGLDFARAAALKNDMTTVVFSLEMSRNEITMRLLSAEARVPLHTMRSGLMSDDDWTRLARRMSEVAEAPLFIDDSPNMSMMEIRAKCRRLKQRQDLKFVIIDYLQLMQAGKRAESRQVEVSEFSRSLKLLAKELDVPVIAVSQLNRGPEQRNDKKPMVSDLRESGSIEQDADVVILLHREDAYEKESPRAGEADLIVAKHRNGPTATVTVAFQGHYSRFVDMAPS